MFQFSKLAIFSIRCIFLIKCLSSIGKELLSDDILSLKLYITTYLSDAKLEIYDDSHWNTYLYKQKKLTLNHSLGFSQAHLIVPSTRTKFFLYCQ